MTQMEATINKAKSIINEDFAVIQKELNNTKRIKNVYNLQECLNILENDIKALEKYLGSTDTFCIESWRKYYIFKDKICCDANKREINNEESINFNKHLQTQERIIIEQDRGLELLGNTVSRLKHTAVVIGTEIDDHNKIINDFNDDVDSTTYLLDSATNKVKRLLEDTSDCCKYKTIAVLTVIFIILLVVIIYT